MPIGCVLAYNVPGSGLITIDDGFVFTLFLKGRSVAAVVAPQNKWLCNSSETCH